MEKVVLLFLFFFYFHFAKGIEIAYFSLSLACKLLSESHDDIFQLKTDKTVDFHSIMSKPCLGVVVPVTIQPGKNIEIER